MVFIVYFSVFKIFSSKVKVVFSFVYFTQIRVGEIFLCLISINSPNHFARRENHNYYTTFNSVLLINYIFREHLKNVRGVFLIPSGECSFIFGNLSSRNKFIIIFMKLELYHWLLIFSWVILAKGITQRILAFSFKRLEDKNVELLFGQSQH